MAGQKAVASGPVGSYTASAVAAIVGGLIVAVVIFVPDVAYRYRRSGRLRGSGRGGRRRGPDLTLARVDLHPAAVADPDDIVCRDPNLDAFRFVDQIRASGWDSGGPADELGVRAVGAGTSCCSCRWVILRWRFRRGVLVALVASPCRCSSTTQLTGLWGGLRLRTHYFDVSDDRLPHDRRRRRVGAVVACCATGPIRGLVPDEAMATSGSADRRPSCDVVVMLLVGTATVVAWRASRCGP